MSCKKRKTIFESVFIHNLTLWLYLKCSESSDKGYVYSENVIGSLGRMLRGAASVYIRETSLLQPLLLQSRCDRRHRRTLWHQGQLETTEGQKNLCSSESPLPPERESHLKGGKQKHVTQVKHEQCMLSVHMHRVVDGEFHHRQKFAPVIKGVDVFLKNIFKDKICTLRLTIVCWVMRCRKLEARFDCFEHSTSNINWETWVQSKTSLQSDPWSWKTVPIRMSILNAVLFLIWTRDMI